jgi:3-hydroxyisobutyrate dehydrogenase-like beta-hydroxyacid dehydrogenase
MLTAMTADDFVPNFPLKLMAKDIGYAIHEGERCGLPLQTAAPALEVFKRAVRQGLGDQDFSAVVKSVAKN